MPNGAKTEMAKSLQHSAFLIFLIWLCPVLRCSKDKEEPGNLPFCGVVLVSHKETKVTASTEWGWDIKILMRLDALLFFNHYSGLCHVLLVFVVASNGASMFPPIWIR